MIQRIAANIALIAYVVVDFGVIVAPALVLAFTAQKGGLPNSHGLDLLIASIVIGSLDALVAWYRLKGEAHVAARAADVWISAIDSLVVLALGSTLLILAVLGGLAFGHAVLVNRGWPVVGLWVGVQLVAVGLAELSGQVVFRWLEPEADRADSGRTADQASRDPCDGGDRDVDM